MRLRTLGLNLSGLAYVPERLDLILRQELDRSAFSSGFGRLMAMKRWAEYP